VQPGIQLLRWHSEKDGELEKIQNVRSFRSLFPVRNTVSARVTQQVTDVNTLSLQRRINLIIHFFRAQEKDKLDLNSSDFKFDGRLLPRSRKRFWNFRVE